MRPRLRNHGDAWVRAVRAALVEALRGASDLLGGHLAHEETEAIPLMQRHITPEEDERIEREHFRPVSRCAPCWPWCPGSSTS